MKKYSMARLNKRVTFCKTGSKVNGAGVSIPTPVDLVTLWCGSYTQTLTQAATLLGTTATASTTIVIRHSPQLDGLFSQGKVLYAKLSGNTYEVIQYNGDDEINAYDLVTLKHVSKIG